MWARSVYIYIYVRTRSSLEGTVEYDDDLHVINISWIIRRGNRRACVAAATLLLDSAQCSYV